VALLYQQINILTLLESLISSKTRLKLLLKFFLNSKTSAYLRGLECEFGESTNAIRIELNRFEAAGLLESSVDGNKKIYKANIKHPIFPDIQNIIKKYVGIDQILEKIISRLGDIKKVYVTGSFADGKDSNVISLLIVANELNRNYLSELVEKTESLIKRKISYVILNENEFLIHKEKNKEPSLLIFNNL